MRFWQHFRTIGHHRRLVRQGCFRVGLYYQGLTHDLSKYSPTEFLVGARYYQGFRSPNAAEREANGYSLAWMHHKGRNRHHFEYWTDLDPVERCYRPVPMPRRYLAEMFMDRRAASMTYEGAAYTDSSPLRYMERSRDSGQMHPDTRQQLTFLLEMLKDKGEAETFRYIRENVIPGKPFPWETAAP